MSNPIEEFTGEFRFLSNFYLCPILLEAPIEKNGVIARSVEHAYQAAKTPYEIEKKWVLEAVSAAEAKKRGKKVHLRADWDKDKETVMYYLLALKFLQHPELREKLLATGTRKLIEGNWWGDTYWGVTYGVGENRLGVLLNEGAG